MKLIHTNHELVERIKKAVREEPKRLNMSHWFKNDPECGTVGCVAGTAVFVAQERKIPGVATSDIAANLLANGNQDEMQLWRWFFIPGFNWKQELREGLRQHEPQTPEYAEYVCQMLDRFLEDPYSVIKKWNS
jgi:hypothetical protein